MIDHVERRSIPRAVAELRMVGDEGAPTRIAGYGCVWNALSSEPVRDPIRRLKFWERVAPGAFTDSIKNDDIGCYFDHETCLILGRNGAGTFSVSEDGKGTPFTCDLPPTSYATDLAVSIRRRDVYGCSIGFFCLEDDWATGDDGLPIRTVIRGKLFDVSPVSRPTFTGAEVALRSLDRWQTTDRARPPAGFDPDLLRCRIRLTELSHR